MDSHCKICNNKSVPFLEKDGFLIHKCPFCFLYFTHPQPSEESLKNNVYSGGYQSNKKSNLSLVKLNKNKSKILNYIKKNVWRSGNILDVGCSNGEFLFKLQNEGYNCFGLELNKRTYNIAKDNGLNVKNCALEESNFDKEFFDVIFLGDLIEHVKDPSLFIKECYQIMKDGGILIISTPNMNCFWSKITLSLYNIFGIPWSSATPPYHLFQFSVNNLDLLMKNNDFSKIDSWFNRPPSLKYELGQTHLWGNFKRNKNLKNSFRLFLGSILYPFLYFIDILITPLKKKDFGMVSVYKK